MSHAFDIRRRFVMVVVCVSAALVPLSGEATVPEVLSFQGQLTENGVPADGRRTMAFSLWSKAGGGACGSALWCEPSATVDVTDGLFMVPLGGLGTPLPPDLGDEDALYLQVEVEHPTLGWQTLSPLIEVGSTPYALTAADADTLGGYSPSDFEIINTVGGNTFLGDQAGDNSSTGQFNTFVGASAGFENSGGDGNTFLGYSAGHNSQGHTNTFIGDLAGASSVSGSSNTFLGEAAGYGHESGSDNVFVGQSAGYSTVGGSGNVFLGHDAGSNEVNTSNKLFIESSDTSSPLIWGDFSTNEVRINGRLGVGKTTEADFQVVVLNDDTGGRGIKGEATGADAIGVWGRAMGTNGIGVWGEGTSWAFFANEGSYGAFTGAHEVRLADDFPSTFRPGMIVSATGTTQARHLDDGSVSLSSTLPTVTLASRPQDKAALGVVVQETEIAPDHWCNPRPGERFGIVNALGEGRMWVAATGGTIEAGDYITTSAVPGFGAKQDDDLLHSYTVAKAIETIDLDTISEGIFHDGQLYKIYLLAVIYTGG